MVGTAGDPRFACEGKVHFLSRQGALNGMPPHQRAVKGKARMRPYECAHCGGWHLGHRKSPRSRILDQRRARRELDG